MKVMIVDVSLDFTEHYDEMEKLIMEQSSKVKIDSAVLDVDELFYCAARACVPDGVVFREVPRINRTGILNRSFWVATSERRCGLSTECDLGFLKIKVHSFGSTPTLHHHRNEPPFMHDINPIQLHIRRGTRELTELIYGSFGHHIQRQATLV